MQSQVQKLANLLNAVLSNPVQVSVAGGLVLLAVNNDDVSVVRKALKRAIAKHSDYSITAVKSDSHTVFALVDDNLAMSKAQIKKLALAA